MRYLSNAFSLGMLPSHCQPVITELDSQPDFTGLTSVVGHATTAAILGVAFNRATIALQPGDILVVAQYNGARLPEGATVLPEGASFRWFKIEV
jgi:hypothetical protein